MTHFPNTAPCVYVEHFIFKDTSSSSNSKTPRSIPTTLIPYQGCDLHHPSFLGSLAPRCIFYTKLNSTIVIELLSKKDITRIYPTYNFSALPKHFYVARYSHPHYRLLTYNDYLIQRSGIPVDHTSLLHSLPNIRISTTSAKLISDLIRPITIGNELTQRAEVLSSFTTLSIYTDGSLVGNPSDDELPIGYAWLIADPVNLNVFHNGSIQYFPSSTKAEIMAILTALIVLAPNTNVTIHTDSQAAIDGFFLTKNIRSISH